MTERKVDLFRYRNLNFARRTVVSHAINDIWGLDLIDLVSKGGGFERWDASTEQCERL